jgi:ABC-2 type transport system ATP-binding protein
VGYVPSDANAYATMKVHEFLSYFLRFYKVQDGMQRMAELSTWFELDLKRKIAELSMGNRKKVSIVQSLLHRPKLLILDEPTTGLDPLMQAKFFELLRSENQHGMTIFFSSHILNEVQMICKRVAIIKDGNIMRVEDIETLRKKQLKKINIEFGEPFDENTVFIPGNETSIIRTGKSLFFMFSGDINALIGSLCGRQIVNLTIEEPSLEEIFMHYYR